MNLLKNYHNIFLICLSTVFLILCGIYGSADTYASATLQYKETDQGIIITKYSGKQASLSLPATIEGKDVVEIGESAFAGNIFLKTVTIPASVKKIDTYAFETCSVLETVNLPESLETIAKGAFSGCGHLKDVTLPDSLKSIEDGAFFSCVGLKKITIPASVKTVGNYTFALSGLKTVTFSENTGLTELGDRVFWKSKLTSITLPKTIKKIGSYTFAEIDSLKEANIGGVEEIGQGCFRKSSECVVSSADCLKTIGEDAQVCFGEDAVLPDTLMTIGKAGIGGSEITKTVTIPTSLTDIEPGAFMEVGSAVFKIEKDNTNYTVVDGVLFTKDQKTLVAYPVEKSGSYEIPEGTETIGGYAFANAQSISALTIANSVTSIDAYAFYNFSSEKMSMIIPETVKAIGEDAFRMAFMKELTLNASIEKTSQGMFTDAEIEKLVLPETLKELSDETFFGSNISTEIPKSVEKIGNAVFLGSKGEFTTEQGAYYTVDGNLLYNADKTELISYVNQNLEEDPEELTLADTVTKIDDYAIVAGNKLDVVNVPDSVKEVGKCSFGYSNPATDMANYNLDTSDKEYIIYSGSQAVKDYARSNALACFQGEAELNLSSVSIKGDEKVKLQVKNADSDDVTYSSNDETIATVSEDGQVTGQRKGNTIIVAAVGHSYFRCEVTVTSDAANPFTPEVDESQYSVITKDQLKDWETQYKALNKETVLPGYGNNLFTWYYKINNYFNAIWSVQIDADRKEAMQARIDKVNSEFGPGWEDAIQMMNHGLILEMNRYKNSTDAVLYSGSDDISLITGLNADLCDLQEAVGKTYALPLSVSTSLDETVPINFGDMTLIFYADKDLIQGGYIEGLFNENSGESEVLFNPGIKIKILDVGVRYVKMTALTDDNEDLNGYHYERYVKCALVPVVN